MSLDEAMARAEEAGSFYRMPPAVWAALARQTRRVDGWWLSPSGAGGCHRAQILKATEPYWIDPNKVAAAMVGTAMHALFETGDEHEERHLAMPLVVPLPPEAGGGSVEFPLRGTPDKYDPDRRRLIDYKSTSGFEYYDVELRRTVRKQLPEERHVLQANIYRLLLDYHGMPTDEIQIFYFRPTKDLPRKQVAVPVWDLPDIYEVAVEAATPLAVARQTGQLPPCTCPRRADGTSIYGQSTDRDLCLSVSDAQWVASGGPERVPWPKT